MELFVTAEKDCLIIEVCGEVDMYAAPDFYDTYRNYTRQHPFLN